MTVQYCYQLNETGLIVYDKPSDPFIYKELVILRPAAGMVLHNKITGLIRNRAIQVYSEYLQDWEEIPGQL